MVDPPWDIHMELPYGTMADDEMCSLNVHILQTDGLIFLGHWTRYGDYMRMSRIVGIRS